MVDTGAWRDESDIDKKASVSRSKIGAMNDVLLVYQQQHLKLTCVICSMKGFRRTGFPSGFGYFHYGRGAMSVKDDFSGSLLLESRFGFFLFCLIH